MRVLHVVPWYEPAWSAAGTAVAVTVLCRSLAAAGLDVTVYTTNDAGEGKFLDVPLAQPIQREGVKVWYFGCGFLGKWKAAAYSAGLSKRLAETIHEFDIVHVSGTRHWHDVSVYWQARRRGVPYLLTPHASLMDSFVKNIGMGYLKIPYIYLVDSRIIRGASAIHYLCRGERKESSRFVRRVPSFVLPNGIDVGKYHSVHNDRVGIRKELGVSRDDLMLLFLGRIDPVKNIHLVIKALTMLKQRETIRLFIVGPASHRKYLASLKRMVDEYYMTRVVKFMPPVERENTNLWYTAADLLVQPSKVEGLSMTVIEAMAASLPVLVSDKVGNAQEIREDDAGIVIQAEPGAIRDSIVSIMKDMSILKNLSRNARRSAEKRYRTENVASQMIKAYKNILSGEKDESLNWT